MKKKFLKFYIVICLLITNLSFATDPTNTGESAEGTIEEEETSINSNLLWLAAAGAAFGLYYFSTQKRLKSNN